MAICRLGIIGVGAMARYHIQNILKQTDTTQIVALCEPEESNYQKAAELFTKAGQPVPPNAKSFESFMKKYASRIDAAFIITPHNQHFEQAKALMKAGKDVLVEKPMVLNTSQAKKLIKTRDKTGCLLAVAFNGSMSPAVRTAHRMLHDGSMGRILSIHAAVWQDWEQFSVGTWRQEPKISGGGFMFDTGAHLLNTLADLANEPFEQVAAFVDKHNTKVDIITVAIARTASGIPISIHGCGVSPLTSSEIKIWCEKGVMEVGVWGEYLRVQMAGEPAPHDVPLPQSLGVWQTFIQVRNGEIENPSPAENGLRMIQLWDAIKRSARTGEVVHLD